MFIFAKHWSLVIIVNDDLMCFFVRFGQVANDLLLLHLETIKCMLEAEPCYFFITFVRFQVCKINRGTADSWWSSRPETADGKFKALDRL